MVQISSSFLFIAGLVISGLATPSKRSISQLEQDISVLESQAATLNSALNAFSNPGGTMMQLLAIQSSTTNLLASLATATTDVGDILPPVSEADGRNILNSLETIKPGILTGLTTLVAKRPAFDAFFLLGASAIVLATLEQLATAVAALEIAMLALAPAGVIDEATAQKTEVDDAFNKAIHDFGIGL